MAEKAAKGKVPITVVTGFLGSGKTTLVNHILTGKHGKKIAVIENEFGEVGIDDALVMETREEIFEMNNGCICCTVRGDLIRILNKLLKRKEMFDAILIETTGLADPAPVIQTFFMDDDIKDACVLDAVLTVVDTKHIMQHLDEAKPDDVVNEAIQQIAYADKILLNKLDLVTEDEKLAVIRRIKFINKPVQIIECQQSEAPLDLILGINAFNLERMLELDPEFKEALELEQTLAAREHEHSHPAPHEAAECHDDHCHDHHHHHHHDGHKHSEESAGGDGTASSGAQASSHDHHHHDHVHKHKHDDRVTSVGIQTEGTADMTKLNEWLSVLLKERGPDLYRSKGILSVKGSDDRHVFQGVHMLLQFSKNGSWKEGQTRVNKLVFIGKNLDREELTSKFKACLV